MDTPVVLSHTSAYLVLHAHNRQAVVHNARRHVSTSSHHERQELSGNHLFLTLVMRTEITTIF